MTRPLGNYPFPPDFRAGVYLIKNEVSGTVYIGSATVFYRRWRRHYNELTKKAHANIHFQRAWDKYGQESFSWCVLEVVADPVREVLLAAEQKWLDRFRGEGGLMYNTCWVAGSHQGVIRTPETRKRMSWAAQHRGAPSPEWRKAVGEANRNNKATRCDSEMREKVKKSKIGNQNTKGMVHVIDPSGRNRMVRPDDPALLEGGIQRGRVLPVVQEKRKDKFAQLKEFVETNQRLPNKHSIDAVELTLKRFLYYAKKIGDPLVAEWLVGLPCGVVARRKRKDAGCSRL